jgi:ferrous iron transport protein A
MTLLNVNMGQTVSVVGLTAGGLVRRRLLDLGFTPGARVNVLRRSPMGDPIAYRIRGSTIALRGVDASQVLVKA